MRYAFIVMLFGSLATASPLDSRSAGPTGCAMTDQQFPLEIIRRECIDFAEVKRDELRDCRISEFGEVGTVGKQTYYYAIYCLVPNYSVQKDDCGGDSFNARYYRERGLAVFVRDPSSENARLLFERVSGDIGLFVYPEKPEIVQNAAGTILYLPISLDGTGHGNASEYYLWAAKGWQRIESETWLTDLRRRIPSHLEIWKGVWPDLHTMRAEVGLYRKGDPHCCPSGGKAQVRLSIKRGKIVITSLTTDTRP